MAEVVITVAIMAMVMDGMILCYEATSARAEWCGESQAAQSLASQGLEQARSAKWDPAAWQQVTGLGGTDEIPVGAGANGVTNFSQTNTLDIPVSGNPVYATNYISITTVTTNPPVRQIRCDCVWMFARSSQVFTQTLITLRGPD